MSKPIFRSDAEVAPLKTSITPDREVVVAKFCEQCQRECLACAAGAAHMNTALPYAGYSPGDDEATSVDWVAHNAKGRHHIMWNGETNELVECGSMRSTELAIMRMEALAGLTDAPMREPIGSDDPHDLPLETATETVMRSANAHQVGGSHYGLGARQHWDLVVEFGWDYFQGQIIKYVMRHNKKNGLQDLEKAQHFLEKYIEEIKAGRIPEKKA